MSERVRSRQIGLRLTEEDAEVFAQMAEDEGRKPSGLAYWIVKQWMRDNGADLRAAARAVRES